jgi:hypothetical protein
VRGAVSNDRPYRDNLIVNIFLNTNYPNNGPDSGLDQNRVFVGINRALNAHLNVDMGFQFRTINTTESGIFNDKNRILLIQAFLTW